MKTGRWSLPATRLNPHPGVSSLTLGFLPREHIGFPVSLSRLEMNLPLSAAGTRREAACSGCPPETPAALSLFCQHPGQRPLEPPTTARWSSVSLQPTRHGAAGAASVMNNSTALSAGGVSHEVTESSTHFSSLCPSVAGRERILPRRLRASAFCS